MYYKKALLKSLKTRYFREYQSTDMKVLTEDCTLKEILDNMTIAKLKLDTDLYDELYDLRQLVMGVRFNSETFEPLSELVIGLKHCKVVMEKNIMSRVEDSSDVFHEIMDVFNRSNAQAFIVGGFIRDTILGLTNKDIDIVTDMDYDSMRQIFEKYGFIVDEVGENFLVMIVSKDGESFEISCFRKDGLYEDGRRPESVAIGSIYDDAQRRDFTINALYYDFYSSSLRDPTGDGIYDISSKTLKFIGKAKDRINEDFLRVFRFYRFISKGLTPDGKSLKMVRMMFEEATKKTAPERIRVELERIVL